MNKSILAGWVARLMVLLLSLVNTKLIFDCVGTDGLAAYSIIISLTPWMTLMNLGLPITVQNSISRLRGVNSDYITMRDHSFGTMLVVAIALSPIPLFTGWMVHKYLLNNYLFVSEIAVMVVYFLIFILGICQLMTQVMYAEHEALWPNIYPAFAPAWTAMVLIIYRNYSDYDLNALLLLIGLSNLLMPIHAARRLKIFSRIKFSLDALAQQLLDSKDQFLFAVMATITLSVDYIVMSRILIAQDIVYYNLIGRLFMALMVVHGVLLSTYWTPVADLIHAGKNKEAKEKVRNILAQGLMLGAIGGLIIVTGMDFMAKILTNGKIEETPLSLSLAFWVYLIIRIWTDTYAMAVQSSGSVSNINKFIPFQASISVLGQYLLGPPMGALGIVVGLILSFVLTASWIIPRDFYRITRG